MRELWAESVTVAERAATQAFAAGAEQLLLAAPLRLVMESESNGRSGTSTSTSTSIMAGASTSREVVVAGLDPGYANGHKLVALKVFLDRHYCTHFQTMR